MDEERNEETENLNQNLIEGMEGENENQNQIINNQNENGININNNISNVEGVYYPEFNNNNTNEITPNINSIDNNNFNYNNQPYQSYQPNQPNQYNQPYQNNQPVLNDKIQSQLGPNDIIKIEYEKAIFSDFEKILQYDPFSNTFIPGLDYKKSYPYHFNPALITIKRYRRCNCCEELYNSVCKNAVCEKILFYLKLFLDLKNFFAILVAFDSIIFLEALITFAKYPNLMNFILLIFVYVMTLYFESKLLYFQLPQPISQDEFIKKLQNKFQTAQRIYFGDDKKVVPLIYHCYKDFSGTLELTKPFNFINFCGRPGTYFLDGKTIREFNKLDEKFRLRGGNCKYYINYEDSPKTLNAEMNYETQSLNGLFSANEINELIIQNDEFIYLAPQGFEKWNTIATVCFFCLVGQIYNNYFCQHLGIKYYKIRKAIFFEEPDQEINEKLQKYIPKVIFQGKGIEFENHSEKINKNIMKPYFDKWEEKYDNENKIIEDI